MRVCVRVHVRVCVRIHGMLVCLASDQSGSGLKKLTMPGIVRYRTKPRQSGIFLVWYWTEIIDAGMPTPGVSFLDADAQLCKKNSYLAEF